MHAKHVYIAYTVCVRGECHASMETDRSFPKVRTILGPNMHMDVGRTAGAPRFDGELRRIHGSRIFGP